MIETGRDGFCVEIFELVHEVEQNFGLCTESFVVQVKGYLSILIRRRGNNKDTYKYANHNYPYVRTFFLRCLLEEGQESGGELECTDMAKQKIVSLVVVRGT